MFDHSRSKPTQSCKYLYILSSIYICETGLTVTDDQNTFFFELKKKCSF